MSIVFIRRLRAMKAEVNSFKTEVASWEKPNPNFTEEQQLKLGNLWWAFLEAEERLNSTLEAFEEKEVGS